MIAYPRALFRILFLLMMTIVLGGLQTLLCWLPRPYFYILPNIWGRCAVWAFGIKLVLRGEPSRARPTIFIANHSSYLDIVTLSAVLHACFISKASVENWPIA
ncbi:MAG TPA: 1-acyl-sn-glycerol-3-phosphate acyltransferase, partial [Alphaproteobacteria bacterium]|nr:1-acyl-sn-glycerol-3-phosphate acyltransferase [Alphaproteobacteria bacterium]